MSRAHLDTWIRLDRVHCHDEGDGIGNAEPYLWAVFFKIDGSTVRLNESLNLEGVATVQATNGSHGNLDNTDVDAGDTVPVPQDVGAWHTELVPIPVPESLSGLVADIAGVAGVVVVLMEEDNVSDAGALAGYQALVTEIRQRLNTLIPKLGIAHQTVTDQDVAELQNGISDAIEAAVKGAQSGWQNFWSWLNADDQIGSKFFSFGHDDLAKNVSIDFSQRWHNEGDWEIFGEASATAKCPANAMAKIAESHGGPFTIRHLAELRAFRDTRVRGNQSLSAWWALAERNSAALGRLVLTDAEARRAMFAVLPQISQVIAQPNAALPDNVVAQTLAVLDRAQSSPSARLRSDAARARDMVGLLRSRTVGQALAIASAVPPNRSVRRSQLPEIAAAAVAESGGQTHGCGDHHGCGCCDRCHCCRCRG